MHRTSLTRFAALALGVGLMVFAGSATAQDAQAGAKVFEIYCGSCHTLRTPTAYKPAPRLAGVVGRRAGALPGYDASLAMKTWGKAWTPALLDAFIADPGGVVPGTTMPVNVRVRDAKKRADLIAFLKQQR